MQAASMAWLIKKDGHFAGSSFAGEQRRQPGGYS